MSSRTNKEKLRRYWGNLRNSISIEQRREKSRRITEGILAHPLTNAAKVIFVYVSFKSEPDTHDLIRKLLKLGKRVAVPVCNTDQNTMKAVEISDFEQLRTGGYGILEPDTRTAAEIPKSEIDLILAPALAFDSEGFRLGYGGGYYDKYLTDFNGAVMGIAFSECITDFLPHCTYDRPVNFVLTEENLTE